MVGFGCEPVRLLQKVMVVLIFGQNVSSNAVITPPNPARHANRADIGIIFRLVLEARQHKATRLYRIGIRGTYY